jgi:hypothetical protein
MAEKTITITLYRGTSVIHVTGTYYPGKGASEYDRYGDPGEPGEPADFSVSKVTMDSPNDCTSEIDLSDVMDLVDGCECLEDEVLATIEDDPDILENGEEVASFFSSED